MNQVTFWLLLTSITVPLISLASCASDEIELTTSTSLDVNNIVKGGEVNFPETYAANLTVDSRSDSIQTDDLPSGSFMVRTSPLASAASTLMFVSFKNLSVPGELTFNLMTFHLFNLSHFKRVTIWFTFSGYNL